MCVVQRRVYVCVCVDMAAVGLVLSLCLVLVTVPAAACLPHHVQAKALPCEALAAHVAGLLLRLPAAGAGAAAAGAGGALELQQLRQALR